MAAVKDGCDHRALRKPTEECMYLVIKDEWRIPVGVGIAKVNRDQCFINLLAVRA
jgi:hypothetical protein